MTDKDDVPLPPALDDVHVFMGCRSDDNDRFATPADDYYSADQMRERDRMWLARITTTEHPGSSVAQGECDWCKQDTTGNWWETSCGHEYLIVQDDPAANCMTWCCFCGKRIAGSVHKIASTPPPAPAAEQAPLPLASATAEVAEWLGIPVGTLLWASPPQPEPVRVDEAMVLRGCNAYDDAASDDGENLTVSAQYPWMHAALTAALAGKDGA